MLGNTAAIFLIEILVLSTFVLQTHQVRKYDLETECLKLYKEDLATVLLRFRRSPEYIKILQEKIAEFQIHVNDVKNQLVYYYNNKLSAEIAGMLGYGVEKVEEDEGPEVEKPSGLLVRRASNTVDSTNKTSVDRLDSYFAFNNPLAVQQRNHMRDLGYTYAGHIIHALIKNVGPYQESKPFTKIESGEHPVTEHPVVHIVPAEDSEAKTSTVLTTPAVEKEKSAETTLQRRFVHKKRI